MTITVADRVQTDQQPQEGPAKRRRRRGAIAQVILFTSIWSAVAGLLGLLAALPTMLTVYQEHGWGLQDLGHRMTAQLDPAELNAILSTSSSTTLAVAVATAIGTALSVWIMRRWFQGPALLDLGLRPGAGWLPDSLVGLVLGPVMFLAILLALAAAGWASVEAGAITAVELLMAFVTFVFVAFSEEVLSRGWVLQVLERGRGTRAAVIGSALVFAMLHGFNPDFGLTALLGLFLAGLLLAQAYVVSRQLWLPMALHLSWNFSEGPVFGFPVSGLPANGLLHVTPTGPDVVTGGAFGPEAGLVVVGGIAIASALLYLYGLRRTRRQPAA